MTVAKTQKATQQGIDDARTFAAERPEDVSHALAPGYFSADEALINALGRKATAKLFGVDADSDAFQQACAAYNRAFDAELARVAAAEEEVQSWTLLVEGEGESEVTGATEAEAIEAAEDLIASGDYELEDGERIKVRYWLTPPNGERGDIRVVEIVG